MEQLGDQMSRTQRVKISGDGAKMSRLTNFVVMSAKGEYTYRNTMGI